MGVIGQAKLNLKLPLLFDQTILCADLALEKKQIMHNMLRNDISCMFCIVDEIGMT